MSRDPQGMLVVDTVTGEGQYRGSLVHTAPLLQSSALTVFCTDRLIVVSLLSSHLRYTSAVSYSRVHTHSSPSALRRESAGPQD